VGVGEALATVDTLGWQRVFLHAAAAARVPWAARIERWHEIETALYEMMARIAMAGVDPAIATRETAARLDRLLLGERSRP
jgi:hypothetical protein